jgi:hypothetical protein
MSSLPIDVKTGFSDPADFATAWIPITIFFVAIVVPVFHLPMFADMFLHELREQLYDVTFFGDHRIVNLAVCGNSRPSFGRSVPRLLQWKTNLNFCCDILQKYIYDGPKSMSGIRIPVQLDPDLFSQI